MSDYQTLRDQAGYVILPEETVLAMRGRDRLTFLHSFCTNDVRRLATGGSCEAFVCDAKGHVLGFIHVHATADTLWIVTSPGQAERLMKHWDRYILREDVQLEDHTASHAVLSLHGAELTPRVAALALPNDMLFENPMLAPSREIVVAREHLPELEQTLSAAGVAPCSAEAWNVLRIESGVPRYGIDITLDNLPQEVNRDTTAISFQKGCYLGQETVARIDALGHVNQRLTGLRYLGDANPPPSEFHVDGKLAAKVTSWCHSPQLANWLGLAYLRRGATQPPATEIVTLPL